MSIGMVMYVEFPAGTNRAEAEQRARALVGDVHMSAPGAKLETYGVIASPKVGDPTTILALKRAHLDTLTKQLAPAPATSKYEPPLGKLDLSEPVPVIDPTTAVHVDVDERRLIYAGRGVRLSVKEFELFDRLRSSRGPVPFQMLYDDIIGGVCVGKNAIAQISVLRGRVQKKLDQAFGPGTLTLGRAHWRQGLQFAFTAEVIDDD